MIYSFNLGLGWASSGVEYAQSYRANIFRKIGAPCKFVFTDVFVRDNIEHLSDNIGFLDSEVIWMYQYFTDFKTAPVTITLKDLEKDIEGEEYTFSRDGKVAKYVFPGKGNFYTAYLVDEESDLLHRVERVSEGCLVRKDYYSYGRVFSEYYAPLDNKAHLYLRRFFNTDGTLAYEQVIDGDSVMFRMKDTILYSKEELVGYMVRSLKLTKRDIVLIDRTTGIGQAIIMNAKPARIGVVIHADHFSESGTNEENILWNNFYEYSFLQNKYIDFYVTATDAQNILLREQFLEYKGVEPNIITIPVGSVDELKYPDKNRKKHSMITASRLANEKHVEWLVRAVAKAREDIDDVSLDIYGKGACEEDIKKAIEEVGAEEYVHLMGQQDLTDVYINYEAYLSGSTSEGFGLTLLEAVSSGLPIIGFNVRYGNQTFIEEGENGYLIDIDDSLEDRDKINLLADRIVRLFSHYDLSSFSDKSYVVAEKYLTSEVIRKWENVINQKK